MEGKDIDRFVKDSLANSANKPHPEGPDHDQNWALIERTLEDKPRKKRTWLYVAAAAIALLLFSNFYWMLEQRSYKEQISAIVLEYEQELAKEPPTAPDLEVAPEPEIVPDPEIAPISENVPEPEIKIVYIDRIIEVPVEVPVYVEPEESELAKAQIPEIPDPQLPEIEMLEPKELEPVREDLIPPSRSQPGKKKKTKNTNGQRSFGLKLALNQNR